MTDAPSTSAEEQAEPRWQPIGPIDRRVAGVLVEKAKTTPDAYPMTLNAIRTGCNQKSNRAPLMQVEPEDIEESLERLRGLGAVGLIEGYGRVAKYRHYLYKWLGVEAVELAVMAELLLRGAQTEGDLRGRAARMEPIRDLSELRPVLSSLKAKGLVIPLTPEGRGHVVTHALFLPDELAKLRSQYQQGSAPAGPPHGAEVPPASSPSPPSVPPAAKAPTGIEPVVAESVRQELRDLREQLSQLRADLGDLAAGQRRLDDELREVKDALGP
jgi:uncharacterized protein